MNKRSKKNIIMLMLGIFCASLMFGDITIQAASEPQTVPGFVYEFGKNDHYEFDETKSDTITNQDNTYGNFIVSGDISNIGEYNGVPSYEVADGCLDLTYAYGDSMLNAADDEWHLIEDKSKDVNGFKLQANILKGAIILQTSKDRTNWVDALEMTNVFEKTPVSTDTIYSTKDVELINGCYYRVIVVYETRIKVEPTKILFVTIDNYEYKKTAEVYEFYAYSQEANSEAVDPDQTYELGETVRTEQFDGYYGEVTMKQDDPHYGWELGNFYVSGYTDKVDSNDTPVFLKNVGDKVTLWFKLNENINKLNGNEDIKITADKEGYDQYFQTETMNFGKGTLIVKYTDYNNKSEDPKVYTNYLEANVSAGADTKVQLFEEGDYEIALDYEITHDKLIDTVGHYRIYFKFSVRNGNCMVYPFDLTTGAELSNSSLAENGFKLDFAKSRYLKINVKREILKDSADGLVEDTRFNRPAKDGEEYTEEGIYTITVSNQYTNQLTTKKIYVGTNNVLKAHMMTGLSIQEINGLVASGASISDDGTITLAAQTPSVDVQETEKTTAAPNTESPSIPTDTNDVNIMPYIIGVFAVIIIAIVVMVFVRKKKKDTLLRIEDKEEQDI